MERTDLYKMVKEMLGGPFSSQAEIVPLEGASSDLSYYRVRDGDKSVILLETVGDRSSFEAFIHIGLFLKERGLGVPEIYHYDKNQALALLEDLGEVSLYREFSKGRNESHFVAWYKKVLETLLEMQMRGSRGMENCPVLKDRVFDYEVLRWETNYFTRYFLQEFCNLSIKNVERLEGEFEYLARTLLHEPLYFMHRDFQSQNIFIKDGKIRIIDFQSAHQGMLQYDLVSLLKDSYVVISQDVQKDLLDYYLDLLSDRWKLDVNRERFQKAFDLAGLQRNMQALGAFSFLSLVKGKERFRRYIPAGINHLIKALERMSGFTTLREILNSEQILNLA